MVVEHVFVTTFEAPDALRMASEFLTGGGFAVQGQNAFQIGGWNNVELTRGKVNAARAKTIEDLPQRVRIEWDRGRVTVAAYIQAFGQATWSFGSGVELPATSPKVRLHAQLLTAMAQGLELLLAHRRPAEEAYRPWNEVAALINEDARRRKRRGWIVLIVLVLLIAGLIGLAIFANTR